MRFIPTRIHGILDYVLGVLLIIAPWLFGFAAGGAETWVPVVLGIIVIIYSLLTNYELGLASLISMPTHLALDGAVGIILAISPWLFGFAVLVYLPHLILGLIDIASALTSETRPRAGAVTS